ncbi:MAG: 3-deoxy-manno-octulosonate cytidylyltransferase [Bacteroidales bacterium]|jgi:3-deoxy-manno-octulosonate cytidylyltransferase (CMP-KDO synthetase)|nr:3-deoxy-manno-octulosonate cytidylyltransferase [Bacteroidales bacterium]MDG1902557.1 3-deoxy-manno-octulosonate cytidylyltransferase [Bacteroidales bacterium]MDG2080417.1 3-deoxy-manno-octulosonate cytidylyltransferase [Bacteroidales bacterium]
MKILGIIPARYESTRFPGKPLVDIAGKSMIQRVYDQACKAHLVSKIIVATDDERIFKHVESFGGVVMMTDKNHLNGTTRCNQVLDLISKSGEQFDVVINIQGDEPMINPQQIDKVAKLFNDEKTQISTLAKKITFAEDLCNDNIVKVVFDDNKSALYFSRQAIPYERNHKKDNWLDHNEYYKHVGIYGYRSNILDKIVALPQGKLEFAESLEQLRWLENGIRITIDITDFESIAIDTPDDLLKLTTKL